MPGILLPGIDGTDIPGIDGAPGIEGALGELWASNPAGASTIVSAAITAVLLFIQASYHFRA